MEATIIESPDELAGLEDSWDALVEHVARPLCSPAWLLAWWRKAAPPGALLRVVTVVDGGRLIGVAPFYVEHGRAGFAEYRSLGAGVAHRLAVVAEPGDDLGIAAAVTGALASARPRPTSVRLEAIDESSSWPQLIASTWPARVRPWLRDDGALEAPIVTLEGRTHEDWLARKSKNFRDQLRRGWRKLEQRGATVRMSRTVEEAERDVGALVRLHHGRWSERGGSSALDEGVEAMLVDAARNLVGGERLRLWVLELDGRTLAAQLCLAAGGEVVYWNGGFDAAAADLKPGFLTLAAAIQDAFERGERRFDLGGGAQSYKLRFADGDAPVAWRTLFPRGARYPLTRLQVAPRHVRERARRVAQGLDPATRQRIKRLLRPGRRTPG